MLKSWQSLHQKARNSQRAASPEFGKWKECTLKAEIILIQLPHDRLFSDAMIVRRSIEEILTGIREIKEPRLISRVYLRAARCADKAGDADYAIEKYDIAGENATLASDREMQVQILEEMGDVYRRLGQMKSARELQIQASELSQEYDLPVLEAHALNNLAVLDIESGDLIQARTQFELALGRLEKHPDYLLEGHIYNNLGVALCMSGQPELAYAEFNRALISRQKASDSRGKAETYHNLGMASLDLERLPEAEDYIENALCTARDLGETSLVANILLSRAELFLALKMPEIAVAPAKEALALHRKSNDPLGSADAIRITGKALMKMNRFEDARTMLTESLKIFESYQNILGIAETFELLGQLEKSSCHIDAAREFYANAVRFFDLIGNNARRDRIRQLINSL